MKQIVVVAAVAAAFALGHALAQEGEETKEWTPPDWMRKSKEHEKLAETVGEFDVKMEMFMEAGKPPVVVNGSATRKSIKNGLWIREDFRCNWGGMPFEGTLIQGYDNFRKQHVHVWFDNMSPTLSIRHGVEKDGKWIFEGSDPDPHLNRIIPMKSVAVEKDGAMIMDMFRVIDGKDQLHMRLTYTKKK